jgi:hypothetical protein
MGKTFGAALARFLTKLPIEGGRERWFSEKVGLEPRYLRRWKRGDYLPGEDNWARFVRAVEDSWPNNPSVTTQLAGIQKKMSYARRQKEITKMPAVRRPGHKWEGKDQEDGPSPPHALRRYPSDVKIQTASELEQPQISTFPSDTKVSIKARRDFPRPDTLVLPAISEIFVLGINLEVAMAAFSTVQDRLNDGVALRLLCADPSGSTLRAFSAFSKVPFDKRRSTIVKNIDDLCDRLASLGKSARWELRVVDSFFSIGVIALDLDTARGRIIAQTYLHATTANNAPTITLDGTADRFWYSVYKESIEKLWRAGRTVKKN